MLTVARELNREAQATNKSRALVRSARIAALALIGWSFIAWIAARALIVEANLEQADAIVVLGGSSTYRERARHAAQIFAQGRAPFIILTNDGARGGWSSAEQRNPFFIERAATELESVGVPRERIVLLPDIMSGTHAEAVALRRYVESRGLRSVIFVTSAYHSRRALWTLQRVFQGSETSVGLEAVAPGEQTPAPALWWLDAQGWRMVAGEYPKMVYYFLRY
jgi:uncharacterized SAM-binding protein YcdF (DUF218 family)